LSVYLTFDGIYELKTGTINCYKLFTTLDIIVDNSNNIFLKIKNKKLTIVNVRYLFWIST
jgi:hypothetical protein